MKRILTLVFIVVLSNCKSKEVIQPIKPSIVVTKAIDVNWTISSSSSINYFELEKLDTTTKAYNPIAKIESTNSLSYSYIDRSIYDSINTYRLKMVLKDNSFFYSTIVK